MSRPNKLLLIIIIKVCRFVNNKEQTKKTKEASDGNQKNKHINVNMFLYESTKKNCRRNTVINLYFNPKQFLNVKWQ